MPPHVPNPAAFRPACSPGNPPGHRRRRAFTLIELLVVLGIIAILSGMAMPLLSMAQRNADRVNTNSLLRRVDAASHLFRLEVGGLPYQEWLLVDLDPPINRLAFTLAHDLSETERTQLRTDVDLVGAKYEIGGSCYIPRTDYNQPATTLWATSFATVRPTTDLQIRYLNRMAQEWARTNIMIGNIDLKQPVRSGATRWEDSTTSLLPTPASRGWACDYLDLNAELRRRHVDGNALVDRWRKPLVYICPVLPGTVGFYAEQCGDSLIDPNWFGFGPRSRRSATTVLASDLRTTASARFVYQAEIWSLGPNGQMSYLRSASVNRDNISANDYLKGLSP